MAIMTRSGRAALADAIRQRPLHLGWGAGSVMWETEADPHTAAFGDSNDVLPLPHAHVSGVALRTTDGATTYVLGTDYTVDSSTGRLFAYHVNTIMQQHQQTLYLFGP